jgi:lipid kinase YegS
MTEPSEEPQTDILNASAGETLCVIVKQEAAGDPALAEASAWLLENLGCRVEILPTTSAKEARSLAKERAALPYRAIVAAGGDGMLHQVANGFLACPNLQARGLAAAPLGTANDFASSLGLDPADLLAALRLAAEGTPRRIDAGRVADRRFVNMASGGFAAEITTETHPLFKSALGGFAYFLTGLNRIAELRARPARVSGPGFAWEGNLYALCVGNGRQAGGGFNVCPNALLDDGLFDVTIAPEVPLTELATLAGEMRRLDREGDSSPLEKLVIARLPRLEVEASDGLQVNLDGEPVLSQHFVFEIEPQSLPFYLPLGASTASLLQSRQETEKV